VWESDIKSFSRAYDLICIVDQIHNFAIAQHRQFVISHLEPWLSRAEEMKGSQAIERLHRLEELDEAEFLSLINESDSGIGVLELMPKPEWVTLKEASKEARKAKSTHTRDRNFLLRSQMRLAEISAQAGTSEEVTPRTKKTKGAYETAKKTKRGRERHRKVDVNSQLRRSPRLLRNRNLKV
jgi:hypothetical protein